jgi:CRISPR-associated protein Cst2
LGSHQELSTDLIEKNTNALDESKLNYGTKTFPRYTLKDVIKLRKNHAAGLLKGLAFLRGGAKLSAFGSDVTPKVLILAGMESANPIFNNLFIGTGERPILNIEALKEIAKDYAQKLATPIYIGIRTGYLQNENEVKKLADFVFELDEKDTEQQTETKPIFVIDSPVGITAKFTTEYLKNE